MNARLEGPGEDDGEHEAQPASCPGMRKRMAPAGASIRRKMTKETPHMMTAARTAFIDHGLAVLGVEHDALPRRLEREAELMRML